MKSLETIILGSIAAFASACPTAMFCDPPARDFSIDTHLSEADVIGIVRNYRLTDRRAIECKAACTVAFRRDEKWEASEIDTCTATIAPVAAANPTDVAGSVQCSGRAIQYYCEGRRPAGHVELVTDAKGLARHLAECAYLEAASVTAFDDLVVLLARLGAPQSLVARCVRARDEEVQHARSMGALATRYGVTLVVPERCERRLSRVDLAIDNATEGCVHEAWAALRAAWAASHATDAELRSLYADIAADEIRHAQLSWDLHAWLWTTLDPHERAQVEHALREALAALPDIAAAQASDGPAVLGLPNAATTAAIARHLCDQLA